MRSGACYQLEPLAHRTDATAGGCSRRTGNAFDNGEYPTPSATPYGSSQNEGQVEHKRPTNGTPSLETWAKQWPTPSVADTQGGRKSRSGVRSDELLLNGLAEAWPTPQAHDERQGKTPEQVARMKERTSAGVRNLNERAEAWATPTVGDEKASGSRTAPGSKAHAGTSLTDQIHGSSSGRQDPEKPSGGRWSRPKLNPRFVEWLMGLPPEWTTATGCDCSATELCRCKPRWHSEGSRGDSRRASFQIWEATMLSELDRLDCGVPV